MSDALRTLLRAELDLPLPGAVQALAAQLAERAQGHCAAVLFYGSALRDDRLDGVLDFYLLVDDPRDWPEPRLAQWANRLLPPNVGYLDAEVEGRRLRCKYAVMSLQQFNAGMASTALDTTLWARFSQPCLCAHLRSAADLEHVVESLQTALITAAYWAAELGPQQGAAPDYWRALFTRTYAAELRVERGNGRAGDIVGLNTERYRRVLPLAWSVAGIPFDVHPDGTLEPQITARQRSFAARRWALRARLGKPLNLLRLVKAAFTFEGAADYVAWKVERHSGVHIELHDWQRRHPVLAAPGIYRRLRRLGVLR